MVNGCLPQSHLIFPCKICNKNVNDKDHAIQCDICNFWVHIKCKNLNYIDYKVTMILGTVLLAQAQYLLLIA